jgi:hypothetical protein
VQDKVEQAGVGLASVNAALKVEVAEWVPFAKVESALNQSEAIEVKVQEAAAELATVKDALALEIDERHHLQDELSESRAQEGRRDVRFEAGPERSDASRTAGLATTHARPRQSFEAGVGALAPWALQGPTLGSGGSVY